MRTETRCAEVGRKLTSETLEFRVELPTFVNSVHYFLPAKFKFIIFDWKNEWLPAQLSAEPWHTDRIELDE